MDDLPQRLPRDSAERPNIDEVRRRHPKAYDPWTSDADAYLLAEYRAGRSIEDLATELQRQPSAIKSRLQKLAFDALRPDPSRDSAP